MSETIENIVREMREVVKHPLLGVKTEREKRCEKFLKDIIEEFADRIEAAHERELEDAKVATVVAAVKSASAVYEPHIQSVQVGNTAKLREAVKALLNVLHDIGIDYATVEIAMKCVGIETITPKVKAALDIAQAALSAPARNCDRFGGDIEKLCEACLRERGLNLDEDFHEVFCEWLLAEAKGETND